MTDDFLDEFNSSFKFDRRIFAADIRVSIAYCDALFGAGVYTRLEAERVKNALYSILKRSDFDKNYFDELPSTDIHSFIEKRLVQLIGEAGRKLRAGRSRIDQTAASFRLWLRGETEEISGATRELQKTFLASADIYKEAVLPSYTDLRRAKPILWAHWCLAYFEMLARDRERLDEVWRRINVLPLGAADSAGTSFEIDREQIARELKFEGVCANSLDAVSDRDFAVEFTGACALLLIHLSRFAEDLILYSTGEFGYVEFSEKISTLANLKAHRKNLSALELIRGKAGRIFGHQTALLSTLKGLPLAYNKDLQEDKQAVFDTVETTLKCLQTARIVLKNLRLNLEKSRAAATKGYMNAGEILDYLLQRNIPFLTAQDTVEEIVAYAIAQNKRLEELNLDELKKFSDVIEKDLLENLKLEQTLASKNQIGGTSPERVFEALEHAHESLEREEK